VRRRRAAGPISCRTRLKGFSGTRHFWLRRLDRQKRPKIIRLGDSESGDQPAWGDVKRRGSPAASLFGFKGNKCINIADDELMLTGSGASFFLFSGVRFCSRNPALHKRGIACMLYVCRGSSAVGRPGHMAGEVGCLGVSVCILFTRVQRDHLFIAANGAWCAFYAASREDELEGRTQCTVQYSTVHTWGSLLCYETRDDDNWLFELLLISNFQFPSTNTNFRLLCRFIYPTKCRYKSCHSTVPP
jgi:hypothetical protein